MGIEGEKRRKKGEEEKDREKEEIIWASGEYDLMYLRHGETRVEE